MTSEQWKQVEGVFHAARSRPQAERAAFLDEACAGNAALRREVESLIAYANLREDLPLESPVAAPLTEEAATTLHAGMTLGHYRIEAAVGAGGMGEVYRAVDTRLNRPVAIKISRSRFTERFRREAQALSALNSPHICTLFDVGPDYLVMELLEGETLRLVSSTARCRLRKLFATARRSRGSCRRACKGHYASGSETGQHHAHAIRGQGSGLWTRRHRGSDNFYANRSGHGNTCLHGARADPREECRTTDRHLRSRPGTS